MLSGLQSPLDGVRIIALEQAVAMPFCSFMLAELGAEVIKIERPGSGDVIRGWDDAVRGLSSGFVWVNANKRDVALDLRKGEARAIVAELVARADVFLENFAPGAAERLGLGSDELMGRHPRLIYCSVSGYGQVGPYRDMKAFDLLVQGESGMLLTNGYPDTPAKVGVPITDLIAGSNAALGITSALLQRHRTGEGSYLDVSMLDGVLPWMGYYPHWVWHQGSEPPRTGMRHQYVVPYGPYLAADGRYINVAIASDSHWRRFVEVVERPAWGTDPAFSSISARRDNREKVDSSIEAVIAQRGSTTWAGRFLEAGLPHGLVRTVGEVLAHPQVVDRELVVEASSPVGNLPLVRFPLASADEPRHVPALGEHTDEVLAELGYDPVAIADFRDREIIG